jgi:hypothetical protein
MTAIAAFPSNGEGENKEKHMEANTVADLLKDEYIMLQRMYGDMDSKGLTIKNWAITVALAIIGTSILRDQKLLLLVAAGTCLVFWYTEAYWRGLSHFVAKRIQEIEVAIQKGAWENELPLQLYSSWSKEYERVHDQTLRHLFRRTTLLPHAVIFIFILVIYFLIME